MQNKKQYYILGSFLIIVISLVFGYRFVSSQTIGTYGWFFQHQPNDSLQLYYTNTQGVSSSLTTFASNGNVGIGTTAIPGKRLEIANSAAPGGTIRLTNLNTNVLPAQSFGEIDFYSVDASTGGIGISGFIKNIAVNSGVSSALTFGTRSSIGGNATETIRINELGNVGIGTNNPTQKLVVNGKSILNGIAIGDYGDAVITTETGVGGNGKKLQIKTITGNGTGITIGINGSVGIGTVNPSTHHLEISSNKGASGNSAIRATYPAGGILANTEFGALANRNSLWSAIYAKQGSANYAAYFDGSLKIVNGLMPYVIETGTTSPCPPGDTFVAQRTIPVTGGDCSACTTSSHDWSTTDASPETCVGSDGYDGESGSCLGSVIIKAKKIVLCNP